MALTRRQRQVLDVVRDLIDRNGYSPSLEEIGAELGLSSVATVHKHVSHLVAKGFLRRGWNQNRSIELMPESDAKSVEVPMVGTIAAGVPLEAVPTAETVSVPEEMVGRRGCYALRVYGDSMIEEHICDGDLILVEERQTANNGETVVALIDGSEATLKRFYREGPRIRLQPANVKMKPIMVPEERLRVQGVVVGVLRKY